MFRRRHDGFDPGSFRHLDDQGRIGRDDHLIHSVKLDYALDHPGHQGFTGQELKRFVGESGRTQSGRYDTKDAHDRS
jgi:hypothetical protein